MPLYEYTCRKCSHTFEEFVPASGESEVRCPECQGAELDRLIGLPARGRVTDARPATNCRGDGPPCGAPWCGRNS
jgi:putative FmdB family regulatory protein